MGQKTGARPQRTELWSHVFYFVAGVGTSLLIYRISGGFPPPLWVNFWSVVSQINSLWAASGFALCLLILVLGLQSLLLLLVWVASLGFLVYEAGMILDAFGLWQFLSFFRARPGMLGTRAGVPVLGKLPFVRTRPQLAALAAGQTDSLAALPAPSPQPAAGLSTQVSAATASVPTSLETAPPERGDLLSNTMSPALPESMRWILRSPEVIAQSTQKSLTEQTLILTDEGPGAEPQLIPSVKDALSRAFLANQEPTEDPLANPFEEDLPANPFEEDEEPPTALSPLPQVPRLSEELPDHLPLQDRETLPPLLSGSEELQSFENLLVNLFEEKANEEEAAEDASPLEMSPVPQAPEPSEDSLANPFESEKPEENSLFNPFASESPEEGPLANPFEHISELSSDSGDAQPSENPLANPFAEAEEQDDTLHSMPAVGQEPGLAKATQAPFVEGQKETSARERAES